MLLSLKNCEANRIKVAENRVANIETMRSRLNFKNRVTRLMDKAANGKKVSKLLTVNFGMYRGIRIKPRYTRKINPENTPSIRFGIPVERK